MKRVDLATLAAGARPGVNAPATTERIQLLGLLALLTAAGGRPFLDERGAFVVEGLREDAAPHVHVAAETLRGREAGLRRLLPRDPVAARESKAAEAPRPREPRAPRTTCSHGHLLDEPNTYTRRGSRRVCRTCKRDHERARKAARRAAREAAPAGEAAS